jgi:hypothetical protein
MINLNVCAEAEGIEGEAGIFHFSLLRFAMAGKHSHSVSYPGEAPHPTSTKKIIFNNQNANNMTDQNYSNHTRLHKLFHFFIWPLTLVGFIGSMVNLFKANSGNIYDASLMALAFFLLFNIAGLARMYALKAQDRAIRAEENFRHFILAGKPLDPRLKISQIVALRFASDAEFPALAQRTAAENLTNAQIKQEIKQWKADHYRV